MHCVKCGSGDTIKRGFRLNVSGRVQRWKCNECNSWFVEPEIIEPVEDAYVEQSPNSRYVITSAIRGFDYLSKMLGALEQYCKHNNAKLLVVPIAYGEEPPELPVELAKYQCNDNTILFNGTKLMASFDLNPTLVNPLAGLDPLCKGSSIIVGHPQYQMRTVSVSHADVPVILTTTGTVSAASYSDTKQGEKAAFNHSNSAIVVESDGKEVHIRNLNFDGLGFYDFNKYYDDKSVIDTPGDVDAIVIGDEHAIFVDPDTKEALFGADGIVTTLKPSYLIRHDVLDAYSISHHTKHNPFIQYAKYISGKNDLEEELHETVKYLIDTTPETCTSIIVSSNHNSHLERWLHECNPKTEPWNAVIYHEMMYLMLSATRMGEVGAEYPNPLQLWAGNNYDTSNLVFLGGNDSFKVRDIELSYHGDRGRNGARGSPSQFAQLGIKTVIGHSHSPCIMHGCYQVGHACRSKLEYNSGPSTWRSAHCIIYSNGKRQMIFNSGKSWKV